MSKQNSTNRKRVELGTLSVKLPKIKFAIPVLERGASGLYRNDMKSNMVLFSAALAYLAAHYIRFGGWVQPVSYAVPLLLAGFNVLYGAYENIVYGKYYCEELVITIASAALMAAGQYASGAVVMLVYRMSRFVETMIREKRRAIHKRLKIPMPKKAIVLTNSGAVSVPVAEITEGQILVVGTDEVIPTDGIVIEGTGSLDAYILTGEEKCIDVQPGSRVSSGCTNLSAELKIKVTEPFETSTAFVVSEILTEAGKHNSAQEKLLKTRGKYFSFACIFVGVFIMLLLPVFSPIPWKKSIPIGALTMALSSFGVLSEALRLAYIGGIAVSAERGLIISRNRTLEQLTEITTAVFNKTGTLTRNTFTVEDIIPQKISEADLLEIAALAEQFSEHPIAKAICKECPGYERFDKKDVSVEEVPRRGVRVRIKEKTICVGNAAFLEENNVKCEVPRYGNIAIHVSLDGKYCGYIILSNKTRENAFDALEAMRNFGVKDFIMLTGDTRANSRQTAASLGLGMVKADLDREGKITALERISGKMISEGYLAFISSGCEDKELFRRSDVGISFGALTDRAALETADVLIMDDDLKKVPETMEIACTSVKVAEINLYVFMVVKLILLLAALSGFVSGELICIVDLAASLFYAVNSWRTIYNRL